MRVKKLETAADGEVALVVALDWQVPVELRKRRDVRVRERWRLEAANGDWMLAGWEIRSADLT